MTTAATPPDSVRLAWPAEAEQIAALQRRSWADELEPSVAARLLAEITLDQMSAAWRTAINRPPGAAYRVLVAVTANRVVGYACVVPSQDDDAEPGADGEVDQLVVDPVARRNGHGSRLLNACVDTLRADGFRRAQIWIAAADEPRRQLLNSSGWSEDGASRALGSEDDAVRLDQIRLHTAL